ncbi:MAG: tyrosine-type recombinase/integrase, partial [Janthinobacterium lividum]
MVARLQRYVDQVEGALAPNTIRAFRADMRAFTTWSDANGGTLPATPDQVVRFIETMAADRAPATVRHYVSSIATFHAAAGAPDPCATPDVRLALKRMHRRRGRAQKQAAGLGRGHIIRILAATPRNTLIGLRDRALLATAYDTLARRSELVVMDLDDLHLDDDGSGTILIRRSKTDQEGQGSERYIRPETVDHLRAWVRAARIESHYLPQRDELGQVIRDRAGMPLS